MVTQIEIARRVGLDVSSVNKILNKRQGPVFRKDTIKKVFKAAQDLGYDFGRLKYQHRRRHGRREVLLGAEFLVYRRDGSLLDQGMATIRDISVGGARVSDVTLPSKSLPLEPFTVALRPMQKPGEGLELRGHIVRIHQNGNAGYGINFENVEPGLERKLRRIANG